MSGVEARDVYRDVGALSEVQLGPVDGRSKVLGQVANASACNSLAKLEPHIRRFKDPNVVSAREVERCLLA